MKGRRKSRRKTRRRKKAGDYSQMAKNLMKKRAGENALRLLREKQNKNLTMGPGELMKQHRQSSKPGDQVSPWKNTTRWGGKIKLKKRKRTKRRRQTRKRRR